MRSGKDSLEDVKMKPSDPKREIKSRVQSTSIDVMVEMEVDKEVGIEEVVFAVEIVKVEFEVEVVEMEVVIEVQVKDRKN